MQMVSTLDQAARVYCNRDVNLGALSAVGFDMDYTIARYNQEVMNDLSVHLTLERLVRNHGYPEAILDLHPDPKFAIRGLVIDRLLGNVLKMDADRHVVQAYHGFTAIEDLSAHGYTRDASRSDPERFYLVDTLYALPEVSTYAALVEYKEQGGEMPDVSFDQLFRDVRASIDLAHRDSSLKTMLLSRLRDTLDLDHRLAMTLHRLKSAGLKLFLLTNSGWSYTNAIMTYLLQGALPQYASWRSYFEFVVVQARKPRFFTTEEPFEVLNEAGDVVGETMEAQTGGIYQGGSVHALESTGELSGRGVLYVGDHIFGDILKSKKVSSWRTCMIVQELTEELHHTAEVRQTLTRLDALDAELARRGDELAYLHATLHDVKLGVVDLDEDPTRSIGSLANRIGVLQQKRSELIAERTKLEKEFAYSANPYWGLVFRAGGGRSIFGSQVWRYADLYTASVGNFLSYSPTHDFRARRVVMPHE